MNKIILSLVIIFIFVGKVHSQSKHEKDSMAIKRIVFEFYDWYIMSILEKNYSEITPQFVENEKGFTTLDFSKYLNNLRFYNFSDSLIEMERQTYNDCISNLEKVEYSTFLSEWIDLDYFESSNCDFSNSFRWIGGMEPIECIKFTDTKLQSDNRGIVRLEFCNKDSNGESIYWGNKEVILERQNEKWKIMQIE
ncbi:MAG: hypothetical protein PF489_12620 [Salinivirgaceae bacterium]|jgi:hypothetical protein|nr:hypothetical protein [Salinivirgaceae bacterium]